MAGDIRSLEELKAEQDRFWAEADAQPTPPGYEEWFREQVEIAIGEADDPNTRLFTMEEVRQRMEDQKARWRAKERKTA